MNLSSLKKKFALFRLKRFIFCDLIASVICFILLSLSDNWLVQIMPWCSNIVSGIGILTEYVFLNIILTIIALPLLIIILFFPYIVIFVLQVVLRCRYSCETEIALCIGIHESERNNIISLRKKTSSWYIPIIVIEYIVLIVLFIQVGNFNDFAAAISVGEEGFIPTKIVFIICLFLMALILFVIDCCHVYSDKFYNKLIEYVCPHCHCFGCTELRKPGMIIRRPEYEYDDIDGKIYSTLIEYGIRKVTIEYNCRACGYSGTVAATEYFDDEK